MFLFLSFPVFDSLPQATFALIGLQVLGYIIAVVGFALCVSGKPFMVCKSVFLLLSIPDLCLFVTLKCCEIGFATLSVSK